MPHLICILDVVSFCVPQFGKSPNWSHKVQNNIEVPIVGTSRSTSDRFKQQSNQKRSKVHAETMIRDLDGGMATQTDDLWGHDGIVEKEHKIWNKLDLAGALKDEVKLLDEEWKSLKLVSQGKIDFPANIKI